MMDSQYPLNIGDRVIVSGRQVSQRFNGEKGTVLGKHVDLESYCIEFDNPIEHGHDCYGNCTTGCVAENGHGWFVNPSHIKVIGGKKIKKKPVPKDFCGLLASL